MRSNDVLPVIVSILVIITIALVQRQSKLVAAITATMPLNVVLGYWVVASASIDDQKAVIDFSQGMLVGIIPTMAFLLVLWLASRYGMKPFPALGLSYATWAVGIGIILVLRRIFGGD